MSAVLPEPRSDPPSRVDVLRVPPHSIEAEQSVLGGLMLVSEAWDQVADRVTEEDFYRREHRLIYRAIGELANAAKPCDAVTLGEWFERHGETAGIGGVAYLAELANNTPSAANIKAYADIVRDKSVLRSLIEAGTRIAGDGFNPEGRNTPEIL
ncbi:MAG: DnaB-like helicase N-terminal domain-containing protein, partial [Rhodanobacteraceae bacterium]